MERKSEITLQSNKKKKKITISKFFILIKKLHIFNSILNYKLCQKKLDS